MSRLDSQRHSTDALGGCAPGRTRSRLAWITAVVGLTCVLGASASASPEDGKSLPTYVLLIDRSGSMDERPTQWGGQEKKIEAVRAKLGELLSALPDGTRVEAILFDHEVAPGPSVVLTGPAEREEIRRWFEQLSANSKGGTHAWRSLEYAVGRARVHLATPGAWVRLLMLTDGEDLEPDTPQRPKMRLAEVLERHRDVLKGPLEATLITLGFELKSPAERAALAEAGVAVVPALRREDLLPLLPEFTWTPESPVCGRPVLFADRTQGVATAYAWDFGATGTSTEKSPVVVFGRSGETSVTLAVSGPRGLTRRITHRLVVQEPPPIQASASVWPREVAPGGVVQCVNDSRGAITSVSWSFGDGEESRDSSPQHSYRTPGTYSIQLTVRDREGRSDAVVLENAVRVVAPQLPVAAISGPTRLLAGEAGTFLDASTGLVVGREWVFGAEVSPVVASAVPHTFQRPGRAQVVLRVRGPGGEESKSTLEVEVQARPAPKAQAVVLPSDAVAGSEVTFLDESEGVVEGAVWSFSTGEPEVRPYSGAASLDARTVVRRFATPGEIHWTLEVTGPGGTSRSEGTLAVRPLETPPVARFAPSVESGSAPLQVLLENCSEGSAHRFEWDFGDGSPRVVEQAKRTLAHEFRPGDWDVILRAHGGVQFPVSEARRTIRVAAPVPPPPSKWPWIAGLAAATAGLLFGVPKLRRLVANWGARRRAWRVSGTLRVSCPAVEGARAKDFPILAPARRLSFDPSQCLPAGLAAKAPRQATLYVASVDTLSLARSLAIDVSGPSGAVRTLALDRNHRGGHGGFVFELLRR